MSDRKQDLTPPRLPRPEPGPGPMREDGAISGFSLCCMVLLMIPVGIFLWMHTPSVPMNSRVREALSSPGEVVSPSPEFPIGDAGRHQVR